MSNVAQLGDPTAMAIESRLKMKLSEEQMAEAQTLAEEYKSRYVTPFTP